MRAAILTELGAVPEPGDFDEPRAAEGFEIVAVEAAGLNPIDLRTASGTLAGMAPAVPSVVCREGVGIAHDGRRVYFDSVAAPWGSAAERCPADPAGFVAVPDGLASAHAVCFGIAGLAAWLALERRAEIAGDETVLILGATGIVGAIAVQAARLLGAGRVVAAGRSPEGLRRAGELGADAVVALGDDVEAMADSMRAAAGAAGGYDVVIDPLWGAPAAAAADAMNFRGRLVQLGQSAGATAPLKSVSVRFRELAILGHTNFATAPEVRRAALTRMFTHAAAGELIADHESVALEDVASAWRRQADSPGVKLVLTP